MARGRHANRAAAPHRQLALSPFARAPAGRAAWRARHPGVAG